MTWIIPDDLMRLGVGLGILMAFYFASRRGRLTISEKMFLFYGVIEISFYIIYYATDRFRVNEIRQYLTWLPSIRPFWIAWALTHYFKFRGKSPR